MTRVRAIRCGMVNCYLLLGGQGSVLVDTGLPGSCRKLERLLEGQRLRLILLTHAHSDHAANAAALANHFGVPVAMSALDEALVANPLCRPIHARGMGGALLRAASIPQMRHSRPARWENALSLADGMSLREFGIEAKAVSLPGHTAGSMGVLTGEGELLAGDAAMYFLFPSPPLIAEDFGQADRSIQKMIGLAPAKIYPGHGAPFLPAALK